MGSNHTQLLHRLLAVGIDVSYALEEERAGRHVNGDGKVVGYAVDISTKEIGYLQTLDPRNNKADD